MKPITSYLTTTMLVILSLLMFNGCYAHFGFSDDVSFWTYDPGPEPPPPPPVFTPPAPAGSGSTPTVTTSNPHRESGYQRPSASDQNNVQRTESGSSRAPSIRTSAPTSNGPQADDGSGARRNGVVRSGR